MDTDEALDRLYSAPLDAFTKTRNELAAELGGKQGSEIKALKKPNIAAWALNQLAREHSDELEKLFEATNRLRTAQRRLMSGGRATDLREATDGRNRIVSELTERAAKILEDGGHAAAGSTLSAIGDSLVAVGSDTQGAELLRKGRLTRELKRGSVVDVGTLSLVEDEAEGAEEADSTATIDRLRSELDEARTRAKDARKAAKDADSEAIRLHHDAEDADRKAKATREAAEFARRAAEARKTEAEEAQRAVDELDEDLRNARKRR